MNGNNSGWTRKEAESVSNSNALWLGIFVGIFVGAISLLLVINFAFPDVTNTFLRIIMVIGCLGLGLGLTLLIRAEGRSYSGQEIAKDFGEWDDDGY